MSRQEILDLYFMDARCKLIDLAAFLDRVDRGEGPADFRLDAFRRALGALGAAEPRRAREVLLAFSDLTTEPIARATTKAACGAPPESGGSPDAAGADAGDAEGGSQSGSDSTSTSASASASTSKPDASGGAN